MSYPVQIGVPFSPGVIQVCPGVEGYASQGIVKRRWPDGSVKHAALSLYVDGNPGDNVALRFIEGTSRPIGIFPVDAAIEVAGKQVKISDLPVAESPLPNVRIYADDTGEHDLASNEGTKGRPRIRVRYWPEIQNAEIRFTIENCNTEAAGQFLAPCRFLVAGLEVFSNLGLTWQQQMIPVGGRLIKDFWLKPAPTANVKFDLGYLAVTKAVPNFDTSVQIDPAAIDEMYQEWTNSNKDISLAKVRNWGNYPAAMGTAGAREDWGCYPKWVVLWLFTGDPRMREVEIGNANLAAMYGMHWRECDPSRAGYKRPIRIVDRPGLQLSLPTNGGDGLKRARNPDGSLTDFDDQGLRPDPAHVPNPFFILWLTTADESWLELMKFWLAYCIAYSNGAFRGPTGREGGIPGADNQIFQTRGQGLLLRLMVELAAFIPDDDPDKDYFNQLIDDCLTIWEGERNVNEPTDTRQILPSDPLYTYAEQLLGFPLDGQPVSFRGDLRWEYGRLRQPQDSPLHKWGNGNDGLTQPPVDWTKCAVASAQWEESVVAYGLLRGRELGFNTQPLLDYVKPYWLSLGKWLANYRIATKDSNRNYFKTLDEVKAVTNLDGDGNPGYDVNAQWATNLNMDQGFTVVASQPVIATDDPEYWDWYKADVYDKLYKNGKTKNPKWAHLPR